MIYTSSLLRWLSLLDDLDEALITDMFLYSLFYSYLSFWYDLKNFSFPIKIIKKSLLKSKISKILILFQNITNNYINNNNNYNFRKMLTTLRVHYFIIMFCVCSFIINILTVSANIQFCFITTVTRKKKSDTEKIEREKRGGERAWRVCARAIND